MTKEYRWEIPILGVAFGTILIGIFSELIVGATGHNFEDVVVGVLFGPFQQLVGVDLGAAGLYVTSFGITILIGTILTFVGDGKFGLLILSMWTFVLLGGIVSGSLTYLAIEPSGYSVWAQTVTVFTLNILSLPLGFGYEIPHTVFLGLAAYIALGILTKERYKCTYR